MHTVSVGKPVGKRPFETRRRRWEDNITMDLTGTGLENVDWIHVALDEDQWRALVNMVMNFLVP
jgi:hypothetical protein